MHAILFRLLSVLDRGGEIFLGLYNAERIASSLQLFNSTVRELRQRLSPHAISVWGRQTILAMRIDSIIPPTSLTEDGDLLFASLPSKENHGASAAPVSKGSPSNFKITRRRNTCNPTRPEHIVFGTLPYILDRCKWPISGLAITLLSKCYFIGHASYHGTALSLHVK